MLQCVFVMTASNITITFSILHGCDQSALLLFQIIICSSNSNVSHATNPYLMASLLIAHCTIRGIHCFLWLIYIFLESSSNLDIMTDLHTSVIICKMREREREREQWGIPKRFVNNKAMYSNVFVGMVYFINACTYMRVYVMIVSLFKCMYLLSPTSIFLALFITAKKLQIGRTLC